MMRTVIGLSFLLAGAFCLVFGAIGVFSGGGGTAGAIAAFGLAFILISTRFLKGWW